MTPFWFDLETFSSTPLKYGIYRYAEDAEIMMISWALGDGDVEVIDFTGPDDHLIDGQLARMYAAVEQADCFVAHNSMFDRTVLRLQWPQLYEKMLPIERWRCTMAAALAHSLPGGLEKLCTILKVPTDKAKMRDSKQLIQLFCKPRPKSSKIVRASRATHPVEWRRFVQYASLDVEAMRAVAKRLPTWNYHGRELRLWHLDQAINDRGFQVDRDFCESAVAASDRERKRYGGRTRDLTEGELRSTAQRDKLLRHLLESYGVELPDLRSSTIERRLADPDLPDPVRELLAIRLQVSGTAVTKYKTLLNSVSKDGRLRGTLQFCGAKRTGRWSGRLFQPQNLTRVPKKLIKIYDDAIQAFIEDSGEIVFGDDTLDTLGYLVRGCIVPSEGAELGVVDLSNIEGRTGAWVARELWKIDAYKKADEEPDNLERDLYVLAYAKAFGTPLKQVIEDYKLGGTMRLLGKVMELALQYQGAVGAFDSMAALYGIDTSKIDVLKIVKLWRKANAQIVKTWYALERAAKRAVRKPGEKIKIGPVVFDRVQNWLRIKLPSGRYLCYPSPAIDVDDNLSYMGENNYTRKWERILTYGGKIFENIVQAIARDILVAGLMKAFNKGFDLVLSVHDELLAELLKGKHTLEELIATLVENEPWAVGLPLAAKGYTTQRYRKE